MKIAIVSPLTVPVPPPRYGGIEQIVGALSSGLAARGHEITVFCAAGSTIAGRNLSRIETCSPTSERPDENRRAELGQILRVLSQQHQFDLIHFNYEPLVLRFDFGGNAINLADFFITPLAFTFHNSTAIAENIAYYRQTSSLSRHAVIFVSNNQYGFTPFFPISKVIYNSIPIEKFPFETIKGNYLLFLGRITKIKGILEAIAVAKRTRIPLIIAAKVDPFDQKFFEHEVKNKIDGHLVRYIGEVNFEEKVEYLKNARCLLFPILWEEPFGLVMVEALATGTPVIAFRRGSVPEIIEEGLNGYIVNDVGEMVAAVGRLAKISPFNCRKSVESRFATSRLLDDYEKYFESICATNVDKIPDFGILGCYLSRDKDKK